MIAYPDFREEIRVFAGGIRRAGRMKLVRGELARNVSIYSYIKATAAP
jgi:hypothetical protein